MTRLYPGAVSVVWAILSLGVLLLYMLEHEGWALLLAALVSVVTASGFAFVRTRLVQNNQNRTHRPASAGLITLAKTLLALAATAWVVSAATFYGFQQEWWLLLLVVLVSALIAGAFVFFRNPGVTRNPDLADEPASRTPSYIIVTSCIALTAAPIVLSAIAATSWKIFGAALVSALIISAFLVSGQKALIRVAKISLLLVASVVFLQWPLRISFLIAAPRLEEIAAAVRAGAEIQTPAQAGVFKIKKIDTRPGHRGAGRIICLWLTPESGQPSVLAQCGPAELMFNVQSHTILSRRWQFVTED